MDTCNFWFAKLLAKKFPDYLFPLGCEREP